MKFFRRRAGLDAEVERALRTSLAAHAGRAPSGAGLPERILAAVDSTPPEELEQPRRWVGWALPAIAAAAAVAAVAVGVTVVGNSPQRQVPQANRSPELSQRHVGSPTMPPTQGSPVSSRPSVRPGLQDVRVLDLTFAGTDDGWALATADCGSGQGRCTALLRTHDGTHWRASSAPPFRFPAVSHIRFATDSVGYAFGPSAFYMTSDGGRTWQRQPGGAIGLETLDGNVVRVTARGTGCPLWCGVGVQTAALGSSRWVVADLPHSGTGQIGNFGISFSRGGSDVYLLSLGHPAGGSASATSTLYRSTDDGRSWQAGGEPCPQVTREVDSVAVGAGAGNRVSVLCMARQPRYGRPMFVATSTDAGASFTAGPPLPSWLRWTLFDGSGITVVGDPTTVLALDGIRPGPRPALGLSHDGGASWQRVSQLPGGITFVGFENSQVGRVVAQHGRSIWTTRDGGRTWTPVSFR